MMTLIQILFWVISFILSFFFVGNFFLNLFFYKNEAPENINKPYTKIFKSISIGFIVCITLYSLIFSKGVSVSWGFVLLFVLWLIYNRHNIALKKINFFLPKIFYKELFSLIIITIGLIFIQLFRNHFFNQTLAFYSLDDYYYYGYTADNMFKNGIEGVNFNNPLLSDISSYRIPYHYFDLWTNSFLHYLIPGNSIHIYLFVFIPIVCSLVFLSLLSVYETFNGKVNSLALGLCVLLTFYFGLMPFKNGQAFPNVMLQPRTFISFWISSISIVYFKESRFIESVLIISMLPIMNIMAAPGVLSAVFIFGAYFYWKSRNVIWLHFVTISLTVLLFIILYYWEFGNPLSNASSGITNMKLYIKQVIQVLIFETLLKSWLFYLPLIIFVIANLKIVKNSYNQNSLLYKLFGLTFLFTIVFSALASFNIEGSTMMFFPASALISVFGTIAIALYMKNGLQSKKNSFFKIIAPSLFLLQLIFCMYIILTPRFDYNAKSVSKKFIEKLNNEIHENSNVGYVLNSDYLRNNKWSDNPFLCRKVHFIGLINKRFNLFNLSAPTDSLKISTSMLNPEFIKSGDLYRFYNTIPKGFRARENISDTFIVRNRINFLVLDSGIALNKFDIPKYHMVSDSVSGYKLIVLD